MRKDLLIEMRGMLKERRIAIHFDSKLAAITSESPDKMDFTFSNGQTGSSPLMIGAEGIDSTVRETFLPQVRPMHAGFMGINSIVKRSDLRIPYGYKLLATVMAKPGAFLLVPQKPDGSELLVGF